MQENTIIRNPDRFYEREHFSPFISDDGRRNSRQIFTQHEDIIDTTLIRKIFNSIENKSEKIIPLNEFFNSKIKDTLISQFNEIKINDLFDDAFENRAQPYIFDYHRQPYQADKSWQKLAATHPVTLHRLSEAEVEAVQNGYTARVRQIAEKIVEISKAQGAIDEIDTDVICKIIQLYQKRRENPNMEFFVNLAIKGNQALVTHLDALSMYSSFTPEQLQSVFYAAAGQKLGTSVKRMFGDEDRLYYRMQVHGHNPTEAKISAEIEKRGYKILSYEDGIAIKLDDKEGKQKFKIGKILKDDEILLGQFRDDPIRQISQFLIVLSRNPDDIARMSTDRAWVSCMASSGMMGINNFHYVPKEIKQGALVAYVVKSTDPDINDPLSRILLKPYIRTRDISDFKGTSEISKPDIIYIPGATYGLPNQIFSDALIELATELNLGMPDGKYRMAEGCYEDGMGAEATVSNGNVHIENPYEFINQLQQNFMNQQNIPCLAA